MSFVRSLLRAASCRHRMPVTFAVAFMSALAVVAVVAAQSDLASPSPAQGTAQVVSQGMTAPPALRSSWRIVKRTIPLRAEARPSDRLEGSAGFLLADSAPIFVIDQDTKQRYRLAPGEAQFVPIGSNQTWASLESEPATAYTIELADRENADVAGEGNVIFKSGSFGMSEGDYDLDLIRDTLPKNQSSIVDATAFPVVVFVTDGSIEVSSNKKGVKTAYLGPGDAVAMEGNLTIRGRSKGEATFVAGVVSATIGGGRTSARPTVTPAPTETPTVEATATPKLTKRARTATAEAKAAKKAVTATAEAKAVKRTATAEAKADSTETPSLSKKERTATAEAKADKRTATAEAKVEQTATAKAIKKAKTPTPTPKATKVPESRTGSAEVKIEVKLCPAGMRPETLDVSVCKDADGGWALALQTPYGDTLRSAQADKVNGHYIRWDNLKAGEYQLLVRGYPAGYDATSLDGYTCCTEGGGYSLMLSRGLDVVGTVYFFPSANQGLALPGTTSLASVPIADVAVLDTRRYLML